MRIKLYPEQKGKPLGNLFGLFFEDLNHAADGGLYAELIQNRDFEFDPVDRPDYHALTGWKSGRQRPRSQSRMTRRFRTIRTSP